MESRHKTDVIMACSAYCPMAKQYEDGVRISYAYTESGKETHATWAPLGNLTTEWGATYPVCYTYDTQGRRTSLSTTRDGTTCDTTTWTHDPYTGNCLSKTYADGSTVTYTYTPDNLPLRTTYPSGKWKENVYDAQRRLCGVIYSSPDMDYELQLDEYGNAVTNTYTHNSLNQIATACRAPASPRTIHHNADGGMSSDGVWSYAYDAEDQLVSVTSSSLTNGAIRVLNSYDYRRRRTSKIVQRLNSTIPPPPPRAADRNAGLGNFRNANLRLR